MPKEILPVLNKPLVQYGVEEALQAGLKEVGFVTGRGKRAIEDHFDVSYELEHQIAGTGKEVALSGIRQLIEDCTFSYTRQVNMKGLGDAILKGRTLIGDQAFGVVLADDLSMYLIMNAKNTKYCINIQYLVARWLKPQPVLSIRKPNPDGGTRRVLGAKQLAR